MHLYFTCEKSNFRLRKILFFIFLLPLNLCASEGGHSSKLQGRFEDAVQAAQTMPRLYSLLISYDGDLVLEEYFNQKNAKDIANVKSVSKSLISALVGIAIEQGHINGVDDTLGKYFSDHSPPLESAKQKITIENLLTMQSGLETTSNRNYGAWVLSENWVEFALQQPLQRTPGTTMQYSTGSTHLLSAIITKTTGQSTLEFARKNLTGKLGFHLSSWPRDPQGIYFGGNDMELTPRQMLSFGELYLNKGKFHDKQIVPADWVEASLKPYTTSVWDRERYYGYGWWIREMAGYTTPYAWGYGGQFVLLVPELKMVIVTTSNSTPGRGRRYHTRRIYDLVEDLIIRQAATVL